MPGVGEATIPLKLNGGLNLMTPPSEIGDNELTVCNNFWYPKGVLTKRPGFFKVNTSDMSSSRLAILGYNAQEGKFVYSAMGGAALWQSPSVTHPAAVSGTVTQNARWIQHVKGIQYIGFEGNMGIRRLITNVLDAAAITNSPGSRVHAWHKNRLFTDVLGETGRIMWSDPPGLVISGALTWSAANTWDVGVEDKEEISAIVSLGDLLVIFKLTSTWVLYVQGDSPANWVLRKISNSVGCAPSNGAEPWHSHNGEIYFISKTGLYKTNGQSFVNLSENIWEAESNVYVIGSGGSSAMWRVTRWNDHLIIVGSWDTQVAEFGVVGYTYLYNLLTHAWSKWSFLGSERGFDDVFVNYAPASGSTTEVLATLGNDIYYASDLTRDNYDFFLSDFTFNTYADGFLVNTVGTGSAYTASFASKKFTVELDKFLRLKWAGLEYVSRGDPGFQWSTDGVSGPVYTPGYAYPSIKGYKIPGPGRCRAFYLEGSHALTSPYEFYRGNLHLTGKVPLVASGTP
jgi:hypothetical protein